MLFRSPQLLQFTFPPLLRFSLNSTTPLRPPSGKRFHRRQLDFTSLLQFQQRHPTIDLLQLAFLCPPLQPLTNFSRQCSPRDLRIVINNLTNSYYCLFAEFLPADLHFAQSTDLHLRCPEKTSVPGSALEEGNIGTLPLKFKVSHISLPAIGPPTFTLL